MAVDELHDTAVWQVERRGSARARRWTAIAIAALLIAVAGATALNDLMERRAIDYVSAEQIHNRLIRGGFACTDPFFPQGASEVTGQSSGSCEVGFATVHISVNPQRGEWLRLSSSDEYSRPWRPGTLGQAFVAGRNWSVGFESSNRDSVAMAREVQAILGGEIRESLPQRD